ncbi:MAG: hypothetical protein VCG02_14585 [Verrucomicrobiota bacterium]|jgi:hypothetical protein
MRLSCRHPSARAGQAMMEFLVGIVLVLVVIGGLIQLGMLSDLRTTSYMGSTREAAIWSMTNGGDDSLVYPYLERIDEGADSHTYSADDLEVSKNATDVYNGIVRYGRPADVAQFTRENPWTGLTGANDIMDEFGMVRGSRSSSSLRLLPIVRNLIYQDDRIDIRTEVYGVRRGGIY